VLSLLVVVRSVLIATCFRPPLPSDARQRYHNANWIKEFMMIQNRNPLRRDIDGHLRRPMTDGEWQLLDSQGHIKRLENSEIGSTGLANVVEQWREAVGNPEEIAPVLHAGGISEPRAKAIEAIVAQEAARDDEVVSFRKSTLRGRLLKPAEVEEWIQRQSKKDGRATNYLRIPIPQGVTLSSNERGLVPTPPFLVSSDWPAVGGDFEFLDYSKDGKAWVHKIAVAQGGVLQNLLFLSIKLAQKYGWQSAQAVGFVLCGLSPELPPLKIELSFAALEALSRVKLTIDPALSPREVASAYQELRKKLMTSRHRALQPKKLKLAVFMSSQPASETQRDSMAAWNRQHPKWKYKEIRNFGRDVAAARRQLLNPGHLNLASLTKIFSVANPTRDKK
jgi:hypothetical protein